MSYTQCPSCGAKALSVATQCPRCGVPFESKLASYPADRPRKSRVPVVVMAVAALAAVLFGVDALKQRPAISEGFSPPPAPAPARKSSRPVAPPQQVAPAAAESSQVASTTAPTQPAAAQLPAPAPGETAPAPGPVVAKAESTPVRPPAPLPEPATELATAETRTPPANSGVVPKAPPLPSLRHAVYGPTEQRYTRNWVNVRKARRPGAPVVTVLRPGEPVQVDSLSQEWYRVVAEGQAVGYVYRGFVGENPPEERN